MHRGFLTFARMVFIHRDTFSSGDYYRNRRLERTNEEMAKKMAQPRHVRLGMRLVCVEINEQGMPDDVGDTKDVVSGGRDIQLSDRLLSSPREYRYPPRDVRMWERNRERESVCTLACVSISV